MMHHDPEDLQAGEEPDFPDDEEDEDEIMAELRQVRREITAEFNDDLGAYFRYIQALEEADRKRGVKYVDGPVGPFVSVPGERDIDAE